MTPRPGVSFAARFVWALALAVAAALASGAPAFVTLLVLAAAGYVLSRRADALRSALPAALGLALFAFALSALFTRGTPWRPGWPPYPSREGAIEGARTGARLAVTALAFTWLVATTGASAAADAITRHLPRWFGRAGERLGVVLLVALRFGPLLLEEGRRLARTVSARAGRKPGLWAARPIAVPLVLSAVRRADRLAYVLEARHFGAARRTPPAASTGTWLDWAVAAAGVLVIGGTALLRA